MVQLGQTPDHDFDTPLGLLPDCHRRIEHFLAVLLRVARNFADRTLSAEAVQALQAARDYFRDAAPKHTADEEESLFPRLRAAAQARGRACAAIEQLESDHVTASALHARADALLEDWLRAGALPAQRAAEFVSLLEQLEAIYREHIRVEDTQVFPLAAELLAPAEQIRVGEEMRARRAEWMRDEAERENGMRRGKRLLTDG